MAKIPDRPIYPPDEIEKRINLFEAHYLAEPNRKHSKCRTCQHPKRVQIHELILSGIATWKEIGSTYGVKRETLRSHYKYHFLPAVSGDTERRKTFIEKLGGKSFPHKAPFEKKIKWLIDQQLIRQQIAIVNIGCRTTSIQQEGLKELADCTREIRELMKMKPPADDKPPVEKEETVKLDAEQEAALAEARKKRQEKKNGGDNGKPVEPDQPRGAIPVAGAGAGGADSETLN